MVAHLNCWLVLPAKFGLVLISLVIFSTGSSTANLLQALEDYLPVLLGLVKEGEELLRYGGLVFCWLTILLFRLIQPVNSAGSELRHGVHFVWTNQEDNAEVCVGS